MVLASLTAADLGRSHMEAQPAALSLWGLPCRYDDLKSAQDNIDLQTTILSRFDLIFIVKDERSMDRDKLIARHVLEVHRTAGMQQDHGEQERKVGAGCFGLLAGCTTTIKILLCSWCVHLGSGGVQAGQQLCSRK